MKIRYPKSMMILSLLLILFILLNGMAYLHAFAMLNFVSQEKRTPSIESLSFWQKVEILLTGLNIPKPVNFATPDDIGLSYETHRFKVNSEVELEAWYIPHAQSKGIILMFHGYVAPKSALLHTARIFYDMGYEIFLVDFRGSGGSNQMTTSIGYYEGDDVSKTLEYVQTRLARMPIILYGQSMGGVAILRGIYANRTQPDAIIIESVFGNLLETIKNRFKLMGLPAWPAAHLLVFWGSVQRGFSGFKHNPIEYAKRVDCPVMMLHGTDDKRATLAEAEVLFNNLRGKKHFERFEGLGHEPYFRNHSEQWKRSVSEFLKGLDGKLLEE